MVFVEDLKEKHIKQLKEIYDQIWFAQNRNFEDIKLMLSNSYLNYAILENDNLVGFSRVISDGIYKAFIYDVIIREDFQNKGLGKLLVERLLLHDKISKINHIELYCLEETSGFYKKLGFEERSSKLYRFTKP